MDEIAELELFRGMIAYTLEGEKRALAMAEENKTPFGKEVVDICKARIVESQAELANVDAKLAALKAAKP